MQHVVQPGDDLKPGFVLIGGQLSVPTAWIEGVRRKIRKYNPAERIRLLVDGLLHPRQLALYKGVAAFRGTHLEPVLKGLEGKPH